MTENKSIDRECKNLRQKLDTKESHYILEQSLIDYLKKAQDLIEEDAFDDDEERNIFIQNVLKEIDGKEIRLASHNFCSQILENLLQKASHFHVRVFLDRISGQFKHMFCNRFASHVLQTLFLNCSSFVEAEVVGEMNDEGCGADPNDAGKLRSVTQLLLDVFDEIREDFCTLMLDPYGSHVIRAFFVALSGRHVADEGLLRSESSKKFKAASKTKFVSLANASTKSQQLEFKVPKSFTKCLKAAIEVLAAAPALLKDMIVSKAGGPTVQTLLRVCEKKQCDAIFAVVLRGTEEERIAYVNFLVTDSVGSHFLQAVLRSISASSLKACYKSCIKGSIGRFVQHATGNYIVQELLSNCQKEDMLAEVLSELIECAPHILRKI